MEDFLLESEIEKAREEARQEIIHNFGNYVDMILDDCLSEAINVFTKTTNALVDELAESQCQLKESLLEIKRLVLKLKMK